MLGIIICNYISKNRVNFCSVQGGVSLVSILGLSWLSGFLYFTSSLSWMGAVFILTNSSQVREVRVNGRVNEIHITSGLVDLYLPCDAQ